MNTFALLEDLGLSPSTHMVLVPDLPLTSARDQAAHTQSKQLKREKEDKINRLEKKIRRKAPSKEETQTT